MDYKKIHDVLIARAIGRIYDSKIHHNHHILPIHEDNNSIDVVPLTIKEHAIIHFLRYKMGYGMGNYKSYLFLRNKKETDLYRKFIIDCAKKGASAYHNDFKEKEPDKYLQNQRKSGISGGQKSYKNKCGIFNMSEEEKHLARTKGTKTIVENKIGMFSDSYREKHKLSLYKKIYVDGKVFKSMTDVSEEYNISRSTVTYRVNSENSKWEKWYYFEDINE